MRKVKINKRPEDDIAEKRISVKTSCLEFLDNPSYLFITKTFTKPDLFHVCTWHMS